MPASPKTEKAKPEAAKKEPQGVGVKEVAEHLGTDPRSLRAFLRRTERAVGKGTRYAWPSLRDPAVKKIAADWKAAEAQAAAAGPKDDEADKS